MWLLNRDVVRERPRVAPLLDCVDVFSSLSQDKLPGRLSPQHYAGDVRINHWESEEFRSNPQRGSWGEAVTVGRWLLHHPANGSILIRLQNDLVERCEESSKNFMTLSKSILTLRLMGSGPLYRKTHTHECRNTLYQNEGNVLAMYRALIERNTSCLKILTVACYLKMLQDFILPFLFILNFFYVANHT